MIKRTFKRGIAMVELIFALVIMGIVLLSAPLLIQQSVNSSNVAFQQESIAAIASHTGIILTKHWDEENAAHPVGVSPILQIANPVLPSEYNLSGIGFENNISGRTSSIATVTYDASVALGSDGVDDFNDVDDYHNVPITLGVFNSENSDISTLGDYVDKNISINTTVTYANDRPNGAFNTSVIDAGNNIFLQTDLGANESHIKFIQARLSTNSGVDELEKNITLNAFSCNLGTFSIGGNQFR